MPKHAILAQRLDATLRRVTTLFSASQWVAVVVLGFCGVAAFGLAPGTLLDTVAQQQVTRPLPLPSLAVDEAVRDPRYWREERIQRGDTVGSVLARLGVDDPAAMAFLHTHPAARPLYQLRPGKPLRVETDDEGGLVQLRFATAGGDLLNIAREGDQLVARTQAAAFEVQWRMASGEIQSSLFGAADAAGLPDAVTLQLAEIFAGDIDFYKDIKRGDRFAVVYEARTLDGEVQGAGRIVAAEFVNGGKTFRAFLRRGGDGGDNYHADDGTPLRKAFLRSPMEFSRITSGFSNARFHPILQETRAHRGTDYAAPTGTPVRATANGKVLVVGKQGGFGNMIHLQHQGAFSTVYAHLSRFAAQVKPGARISQGEVIGYVGQTGWATGPHLHYEFRVANEQRNPQTVVLPTGLPLAPAERAQFAEQIAPLAAQIVLARSLTGIRIALGE